MEHIKWNAKDIHTHKGHDNKQTKQAREERKKNVLTQVKCVMWKTHKKQ